MTVSPRLAAAIDVFTELGWATATVSDVETLPLGTPDQQRTARDGLSSGEWGGLAEIDPGRYSWAWVSWIEVDHTMLALFALRVGVAAPRAARLLRGTAGDDPAVTRLLAARGPRFAEAFVASSRRSPTHAVRLVDLHDLPVPEDPRYLADWSRSALAALDLLDALDGKEDPHLTGPAHHASDVSLRRLPEHVRAGVSVGLPATETFGLLVSAAVRRGLLSRGEALELVLVALDAAQRPVDRKVWAQVLTGPVGVTDAEMLSSADALVTVLAHGDGPVIELLAPRLIARAPDEVVGDVLLVTLPVRTKKVLRLLLIAAAQRPAPPSDVVEAVAPLVLAHADSTDRPLARAAAALIEGWGLEPAPAAAAEAQVHGMWQPTPPVWHVPKFLVADTSPTRLTEAAAALTSRPDGVVDLAVEHFLAHANAAARDDLAAARSALGGVRPSWVGGLRCVPGWVAGEPGPLLDRPADPRWEDSSPTVWEPSAAREGAVVARLGDVPVLLSSPTWEDLRIDPADLVARLTDYVTAATPVAEADLFLAMTRTDLSLVTDDVLAALEHLPVPVLLQSGRTAPDSAGTVLLRYLSDPVLEPTLTIQGDWRTWSPKTVVSPSSLSSFPARIGSTHRTYWPTPEDFPTWGDAAGASITHSDTAEVGLLLRQVARRATPLTPGLAINLIGAQRGFHPAAAADGSLAIIEAWERGLLRPGVADVRFLDWRETPSSLASLARVCVELAQEGLLSVVWPVLDDLVLASLRAPRMLAGTAEVTEALHTLLPEVRAALASGVAGTEALELPGVRALAARPGSSHAVTAARKVVALLPVPPTAAPAPLAVVRSARPFDEVWAPTAGTRPATDDGASVTAQWVDRTVPGKMLAVDLTLPDHPGTRFRVVKSWFYDLEHEGQCAASTEPDSSSRPHRPDSWLRWEAALGRLVVSPVRDRHADDEPLSAERTVPPLTTSMTAVILASLCHDNASDYSIKKIVHDGLIGSASVAVAMRALLPHPDVSPARMVSLIESDPTTLPVLWPVLTESVSFAAQVDGSAPRWLNRVLDVALLHADLLREAHERGLLPPDAASWPGLDDLAARTGSSTVPKKARALLAQLAL